jgi:hypothetical protein
VHGAERQWVLDVDQNPGTRWHSGGIEFVAPRLCRGVQRGEVD